VLRMTARVGRAVTSALPPSRGRRVSGETLCVHG
jgi:hypothetical protein